MENSADRGRQRFSGAASHRSIFPTSARGPFRQWAVAAKVRVGNNGNCPNQRPGPGPVHVRQLKALGVRIAMDDFGTGYSSLSNLRAFPFDKIKIDRSFIKSIDTNAQAATIVRAVVGIGAGLGLPVLAEGVETPAELRFLIDHGCDQAQGYLLARPASIGDFTTLTGSNSQNKPMQAVAPVRLSAVH